MMSTTSLLSTNPDSLSYKAARLVTPYLCTVSSFSLFQNSRNGCQGNLLKNFPWDWHEADQSVASWDDFLTFYEDEYNIYSF